MVDIAAPDEAEILGTAVTASGLATHAPVRIPVQRYISAEFAELEHEMLWPRVWHVACTTDHVANPGDWFEHRLGRYSGTAHHQHEPPSRALPGPRARRMATGPGLMSLSWI